MKAHTWLSRAAEQRFCSVHPNVMGIDEAGRGPLAGPVVTAACYVTNGVFIEGIKDSKQTSEEEREHMYEILVRHPDVHWAATVVSHTEIDEVNILQATMNGMQRSAESLLKKISTTKPAVKGSFIALVDGNRVPKDMPVEAEYVIKGDGSIFSIAAASIIAKVTRDRIMVELDKEFPQYNLAQHKGYPTFEHRSLLMKHGPCRIHRTSYAPVRLAMQAQAAKAAAIESAQNAPSPDPEVVTLSKSGRRIKSVTPVTVPVKSLAKTVPARGRPRKISKAEEPETVPQVVLTKKASTKRTRTAVKTKGSTSTVVIKEATTKPRMITSKRMARTDSLQEAVPAIAAKKSAGKNKPAGGAVKSVAATATTVATDNAKNKRKRSSPDDGIFGATRKSSRISK